MFVPLTLLEAFMSILSAVVLLLLVLDPIGNIPLFLCALKPVPHVRHRHIIIRESFIGLAILMLFLFGGRYILTVLHISQSSLSIAGGIILFMIAIKMVFAGSETLFGDSMSGEPFIVPLAIPLIAGPSAMSTLLLMMAREPGRWLQWLGALVVAWGISVVILLFSSRLSRFFGERGLTALERLMGMILVTVAVEMFMSGVHAAIP
jgi:multiple antibiotic resistance protein